MSDYIFTYSDGHEAVLTHHGIKGQKWGERRYQYEDGTYTPEGKIRYGIGSSGHDSAGALNTKLYKAQYKVEKDYRANRRAARSEYKARNKELSNKEDKKKNKEEYKAEKRNIKYLRERANDQLDREMKEAIATTPLKDINRTAKKTAVAGLIAGVSGFGLSKLGDHIGSDSLELAGNFFTSIGVGLTIGSGSAMITNLIQKKIIENGG